MCNGAGLIVVLICFSDCKYWAEGVFNQITNYYSWVMDRIISIKCKIPLHIIT